MKKYMALLLAVALFIQLGFSSMATEQDVSVTADENIEETAEEEDLKADAETAGEEEAEDGENAEIAGEEETEAGEDAEIAGEEETENGKDTEAESAADALVGENTEAESVEDAGEGEAAEEANEDEMIVFNASVDGVDIVAAAAAGVFPEGTTMSVSMLDAEDEDTADQYNEAEAMLTESEVAYDGFVAIDISFFYVNDENESEKIEPEDGTVSVKISVDTNLLGENADKDSLSVQHLEEDEDGSIEIKTVADAASGSVTVENGSAEAEFEVESFSTYVVTWVDNSEEHKYIKDQKPRIAHLYFVDVSGNDISDKLGVLENEYEVTGGGNLKSCVDGSNVDNALNVLGEKYNNKNGTSYSYVAAHLDDIDGTVATNISYNDNGEKGAGWHYHDGNNWQLWGTFETEEGTRSGKTDEEVDVYLVYYNTKLTEVNTVDSTSLGITMRMIDYSTAANGLSNAIGGSYEDAEGNRGLVKQGLLESKLTDGYPVTADGETSLASLFSDGTVANHLFLQSTYDETGYLEYSSFENYAYLGDSEKLGESADFTVYEQIGTPSNEYYSSKTFPIRRTIDSYQKG